MVSVFLVQLSIACQFFSSDQGNGSSEAGSESRQGGSSQIQMNSDSGLSQTEKPDAKLTWEELKVGTGDLVSGPGSELTVEYLYRILGSDRVIEDSRKRSEAFRFILGARQVIPGWDQGLIGMKAGGLRKLQIPPEMAYGKRGISGLIPPDAHLEFEIELIGLKNPKS